MKPFQQFLSLIAFEFRSRIQLVFMLIPLGFLSHLQFKAEIYRGLGGLQQPILLFIFVLLAALLFKPSLASNAANKAYVQSFLEFLFTRALDRTICFRAKMACLILVFTIPLILWSPVVLAAPRLTISLLSARQPHEAHNTAERYLKAFSDTEIVLNKKGDAPDKIILPQGRLLLLGWALAWNLFLCLTAQWLVFFLAKFRHGNWILWSGFAICIFSPMLLTTVFPSQVKFLDKSWIDPLILGFYQQPFLWIALLIVYGFIVERFTRSAFLKTEVS